MISVVQDKFEDASDLTPKPRARSPETTRSLTDRRPSSAASTGPKQSENTPTPTSAPSGHRDRKEKTQGGTTGMKPPLLPKRGTVSTVEGMDEVSLGNG